MNRSNYDSASIQQSTGTITQNHSDAGHLLREAKHVAEWYEEAEWLSVELQVLHDELPTVVEGEPSASDREQKRSEASLHFEGRIRRDYKGWEVQKRY